MEKALKKKNQTVWEEVWESAVEQAFIHGEKAAAKSLKLKWVSDPSRAQRYFDTHGLQFIEDLTETDIGTVRQAIADNWGIGEKAFAKLDEALKSLGDEARAKRVYRTEIHTAHEQAAKGQAEDLGAKWWVWVAVMDQRTRDTHWEVNGEIQPFGESFNNGTEPAEEVNCRCRALSFMTLKEAREFVANLSTPVSAETAAWNASLTEEAAA